MTVWDWDIVLVLLLPAFLCALALLMGVIVAVIEWRHRR